MWLTIFITVQIILIVGLIYFIKTIIKKPLSIDYSSETKMIDECVKNDVQESILNNQVNFKESTMIRRFKKNQKYKFINHIKFIKQLIKDKNYPKMNIYALEGDSGMEYPYLIAITGSKKEYLIAHDEPELAKKYEETIKLLFNGDFDSVTPNNQVKDTPGSNEIICDLELFDETKSLIADNKYKMVEKIFVSNQNSDLMSGNNENINYIDTLISIYGNKLITCISCDKQFQFKKGMNLRLWNDDKNTIYYVCPICENDLILSTINVDKDLKD